MKAKINRRLHVSTSALALSALCFSLSATVLSAEVDERPANVIIVFADDLGYGDLSSFGSPSIKTPHLDQMAREGVRFTDFYSTASICTPSRAALLTGCYAERVSMLDVLFPAQREGLHPDEITIAEMLKDCGYATTCIGKWHLGDYLNVLPTNQGFDSYYGIPFSNDMYMSTELKLADDVLLREGLTRSEVRPEEFQDRVPLMRDNEVIEYPCDQTTLTRRYTEKAVKFIKDHRGNPFFLYLPHAMPHIPLFTTPEFQGRSARGLYGDVVEELDWSVGEILKTLADTGLDERTLVIFISDNGPWFRRNGVGGSAGPLRGYKFQSYEGGTRVPCIMRWPGKIPAHLVCHEPAATIDLLPTIAHVADAAQPMDRVIDGKNIWSLMTGVPGAKSPHEAIYYYTEAGLEAIRQENWKLRRVRHSETLERAGRAVFRSDDLRENHRRLVRTLQEAVEDRDTRRSEELVNMILEEDGLDWKNRLALLRVVDLLQDVGEIELFDLQLDVSEEWNVARQHPETVERLLKTMDAFDRELKANIRPPLRRPQGKRQK